MVDAKAQSTKLCSMEMGQEVKKKKKKTFPSSLLSIDHIEEIVTNSFLLPSLLVSETHSAFADEAVDKCSASIKSISKACASEHAGHLDGFLAGVQWS